MNIRYVFSAFLVVLFLMFCILYFFSFIKKQRESAQTYLATQPWITVAPNKRYFIFEDGKPFFPIGTSVGGEHVNFDYFGTVTLKREGNVWGPETLTFDPDTTEKRFQEMKANGENMLRIDIGGVSWYDNNDAERLIKDGKIQFIENPAGRINEEYAKRIDRFIELAEKYGIYIDMVLFEHTCQLGALKDNFLLHPYSKEKGGPLNSLNDFFQNRNAQKFFKSRIRYVVDHWGSSPNIFTWELWNELGFCGNAGSEEKNSQWVKEMGEYLRSYEFKKYGKNHLINVSSPGFYATEQFFYDSPGTDMATIHNYSAYTGGGLPKPVEATKEIISTIPKILDERVKYKRPLIENEHYTGTNATFLRSAPELTALATEIEHNIAWSYLASGIAGSGARWVHYDRYIPDTGYKNGAETVSGVHKTINNFLGN